MTLAEQKCVGVRTFHALLSLVTHFHALPMHFHQRNKSALRTSSALLGLQAFSWNHALPTHFSDLVKEITHSQRTPKTSRISAKSRTRTHFSNLVEKSCTPSALPGLPRIFLKSHIPVHFSDLPVVEKSQLLKRIFPGITHPDALLRHGWKKNSLQNVFTHSHSAPREHQMDLTEMLPSKIMFELVIYMYMQYPMTACFIIGSGEGLVLFRHSAFVWDDDDWELWCHWVFIVRKLQLF